MKHRYNNLAACACAVEVFIIQSGSVIFLSLFRGPPARRLSAWALMLSFFIFNGATSILHLIMYGDIWRSRGRCPFYKFGGVQLRCRLIYCSSSCDKMSRFQNRYSAPVLYQKGYGYKNVPYHGLSGQSGKGFGGLLASLFRFLTPAVKTVRNVAVPVINTVKKIANSKVGKVIGNLAKRAVTSDSAKKIAKDLGDTAISTGMQLISNADEKNPLGATDIIKHNIAAVGKRSGDTVKKSVKRKLSTLVDEIVPTKKKKGRRKGGKNEKKVYLGVPAVKSRGRGNLRFALGMQ